MKFSDQAFFQAALQEAWRSQAQAVRSAKAVRRSRQAAKSSAPIDRLEERASLRDQIAGMQRDGMLAVQIWEIESTDASAVIIPATVMSYVKLERDIYSDPDALITITPISEEDARYFYPELQFKNQ